MANPQLENGYITIANEIMEALNKIRISGEAWQILGVILRKTYGFHKKEDKISNSQFVVSTGMKKNAVCRAVNKLIFMNVVTKKENNNIPIYCFNKDFDTWKPLPKKRTVTKKENAVTKKENAVTKKENNCYQKRDPQNIKETNTKEIITKEKSPKKFSDDSGEMRLSKLLYALILERNPNQKYPNMQTWAYQIDLMIRKDNRDPENIKRVIEWCQKDNFWQNNILSPIKLREQYDQLFLKMVGNKRPKWQSGIEEWLRMHGEIE